MSLPDESQAQFTRIALFGPALYFEAAVPPEDLHARFETLTPATARDFFLLRTLAEVQKFGFASQRWPEERARALQQEAVRDVRLESLVLEESAWLRRLLEALVTLICFQGTNDHRYYFHYLALAEYERARHVVDEEKDFFGAVSESALTSVEKARKDLNNALSALPDSARCWYLSGGSDPRLKSFRKRYILALKAARPAERTALGYTYEASFGAASDNLHFSVLQGATRRHSIDSIAMSFCGLLSIALIVRAHELSNVAPRGLNAILVQSHRGMDARDLPMSGRAAVGDFIVIEGPQLAEVIEVVASAVGYESYRVRILSGGARPATMSVPALAISMFMKRSEMIANIEASLAKDRSVEPPFSGPEIVDALREAVLTVWTYAGPSLCQPVKHPEGHGT